MASVPDFELISSTRYSPHLREIAWNTDANAGTPSPYLLLSYHRDRLLSAAATHKWATPADFTLDRLEGLFRAAIMGEGGDFECPEGDFRIRILLSFLGSLSVTATPIPSLPVSDIAASSLWLPASAAQSLPSNPLVVFLDTEPTPSSLFTRTKTTCRDHYTAARNRFHIPPPPAASPLEVLLYNEDGDITETSIRNIAFARRSPPRWVTPSASTGCLPGVMRRWLLENGRIVEAVKGELKRDGVVEGEYVLTFNGVEGCRIGQIRFNE